MATVRALPVGLATSTTVTHAPWNSAIQKPDSSESRVRNLTEPSDSNVLATMGWLIQGASPVQSGVAPGAIALERASAVHGTVADRDGNPLTNVSVSVSGHPELGSTRTRTDGQFHMLVNGGGDLSLEFRRSGFLQSNRKVTVLWNETVHAPDVVLILPDPNVTDIDLTSLENFQVAQGSLIDDGDGQRQATLLFPSLNEAEMVFPDGTVEPLTNMRVRATEYTVGPTGPEAMPAASSGDECVHLRLRAER